MVDWTLTGKQNEQNGPPKRRMWGSGAQLNVAAEEVKQNSEQTQA